MEDTTKYNVTISIEDRDGTVSLSANGATVRDDWKPSVPPDQNPIHEVSELASCLVHSMQGVYGMLRFPDVSVKIVFLEAFLQACEQDNGAIHEDIMHMHEWVQGRLREFGVKYAKEVEASIKEARN